jgi:diamine N-acetyltransferase
MRGAQIFLRALEPGDLPLLKSWENNPEFWRISNTLQPFSDFTLEQYLLQAHQTIVQTGQVRFVMALVDNQKPIGAIDLFEFDALHQRVGVGILIASQNDRTKGFASEALQLVLQYCFDVLMVHQVFCNISATNTPSLRLFQKLGFEVVCRKKDWLRTPDGFEDELILQCFRKKA